MQPSSTPLITRRAPTFPRAVILCERSGDHCNRLFQSIHFHAFCLEHGLCFWNPTLLGMLHSYGLISPHWGNNVNTFLGQISKLLQRFGVDHGWQVEPSRNHWLQCVGGWSYRCHALTVRYRKTFQQSYRLRRSLNAVENNVLIKLQRAKAAGAMVVGVHVRRGDYQQWQEGRYYFSDESYASIISQIRDYYTKLGHSSWVVVCSNDPEEPSCGQDQASRGRWYADQLVLQSCDVLVGPPSTFTLWASYIAEIPLLQINSAEQIVDFDNAFICEG